MQFAIFNSSNETNWPISAGRQVKDVQSSKSSFVNCCNSFNTDGVNDRRFLHFVKINTFNLCKDLISSGIFHIEKQPEISNSSKFVNFDVTFDAADTVTIMLSVGD